MEFGPWLMFGTASHGLRLDHVTRSSSCEAASCKRHQVNACDLVVGNPPVHYESEYVMLLQ